MKRLPLTARMSVLRVFNACMLRCSVVASQLSMLKAPVECPQVPGGVCRWAAGLGRAATLLLGDISFLHDINGLNLLRTGKQRAMTGPQHPRYLIISL